MQPNQNNKAPPMKGFTTAVGPSPLLARLQSFLPQLKASNDQLERDIQAHGKQKFSIEPTKEELDNATTQNRKLIKLDLSLGVLEDKGEGSGGKDKDNGIVLPTKEEEKTEFVMKYRDTAMALTNTENNNQDDDDTHLTEENKPRKRPALVEVYDETNSNVEGEKKSGGSENNKNTELVQLGRDVDMEKDYEFATKIINPFKNAGGEDNAVGEDGQEDGDNSDDEDNDDDDDGMNGVIAPEMLADVVTPLEALEMMKQQYGYEAMGDVSITMDMNEHAINNKQDDEMTDSVAAPLVQEYTE